MWRKSVDSLKSYNGNSLEVKNDPNRFFVSTGSVPCLLVALSSRAAVLSEYGTVLYSVFLTRRASTFFNSEKF